MNNPVLAALISSTVSLVGVVAGFLWNGHLQREADRRRDEGERRRYKEKLDHDTMVLRAAVLGELESLIQTYKDELPFLDHGEWTFIPVIDFFSVYRIHLSRIGILTAKEVQSTTMAYYTFQERMSYIARTGEQDIKTTSSVGGNCIRYLFTDGRSRDDLRNDLMSIITSAEAARDAVREEMAGAEHGATAAFGTPN